ncbi:MAG: hypothetical protein IID45_03160 [Planctomycetes bacterium]|nr:hypothetical protein [Planctomycetota bacterium]
MDSLRRPARRLAAVLTSHGGISASAGCLAGLMMLADVHLFLATFGTGLVVVTALAVSLAVGFEFAWKPFRSPSPAPMRITDRSVLLFVAPALWIFALHGLMGMALSVAATIPSEVMALPGRALLFQLLVGLVLIAVPLFWLIRIPIHLFFVLGAEKLSPPDKDEPVESELPSDWFWQRIRHRFSARFRHRRRFLAGSATLTAFVARFLLGAVFGVLFGVFVIAPWLGLQLAGCAAAAAFVLLIAAVAVRTVRRGAENAVGNFPGVTGSAAERMVLQSQHRSLPLVSPDHTPVNVEAASTPFDAGWCWLTVACLGGLLAVILRMTFQLAAASGSIVYSAWAAVLLGVAAGFLRRAQAASASKRKSPIATTVDQHDPGRDDAVRACLLIAVWSVVVLASFGWQIQISLLINASLAQPWLLMLAQTLLLFCVLFPFGFSWGRIAVSGPAGVGRGDTGSLDTARFAGRAAETVTAANSTLPSLQLFALTAGFLAVRWVAFPLWPLANLFVALVWMLFALAAVRWWIGRPLHWPRTQVRRLAALACLVVIASAPWLRSQYDPVKASRQLFATNVFVAHMHGLDTELLSFLDEGRVVAVHEGERGTFTVWRYRGNQLQIRESGVPKAIVSTKPHLCPHFTAEVMQAVMPLVLHEHPYRVMILGLGGGVPLTTSLSFPVKQVTCVESDPHLADVVKDLLWKESGETPFQDDRLRYLMMDPALAVACRGGDYDVVISSPDQSALLQASPYFTIGFYRGVSRQLAEDGIFCQRFHQVDYGAMPLQTVVKTMQTVFRNVVAIQIASGEMALLATNSSKGLSRPGLVSRFQTLHVRRSLSEIGWDWIVPLNLTAYGHDGLKQFAAAKNNGVNTAANGRLAFRLPQEMRRWGPKWQELMSRIGPLGSRFLESKGIDIENRNLVRRLSEVTGQRKLMSAVPDQWWAYRKMLKKQLREQPRTLVRKVSDGPKSGRFHSEDRQRMRYFAALNRAAANPSPETIQRVASFEQPYDPLVSYFLHQEAAALYSRSREKDLPEELRHRLHAVYFADAYDRSVRNVASALTFLAKHPTAINSPTSRWDQMNALLQTMKRRWTLRGLVAPKSATIVLNDIDKSLAAIDRAISVMGDLAGQADVSAAAWQARRRVLQRGLVSPLRTYRTNLLRFHLSEKRRLKQLLESLDDKPPPIEALSKDGPIKGKRMAN